MADAATTTAGEWSRAARDGRAARLAAVSALAAGLLWFLYGWFELATPFGVDTVYDDRRGFEVVVDRALFALYSLAGACALGAAAATVLRLASRSPADRARSARALAHLALVAALVAATGAAVGFVPLFFAPQTLGTPILGAATWLAAGLAENETRRLHLRCLAVAAVALLGLWPAVWAIEVLLPAAGAALIGCFGLGWAALAPAAAQATGRRPLRHT
ncbi:MAG: hypothetical protein AVDCRST_MAG69-777 [uncultured Solirubrobacteraceae bacterium]|uniref:DUF998 domain-containing protein n=1 Tax=uncultured Solirubrobacteraceae bacterium TaxID=1162706 RepID=A0A6J4RZ86_9ACTN|nr:MAG: hypothetical protein AVDCRST_MAG69-777 [uncultured Solirubrobacteraceae bacterium]